MQAKILNKEEVKKIEMILRKNYGARIKFKDVLFKTSREKIWIGTKKAFKFLNKLRVNSLGLYFGRIKRNEKIQLSIEGSQIVGEKAKKNIVIIDEENLEKFLQGLNFFTKKLIDCELNNFVLVKFKEDFVGSGILRGGYVENILPKARRIFIELKKV
jgi:NOL1/NOP2/fmu family ribosome biogenesis protein